MHLSFFSSFCTRHTMCSILHLSGIQQGLWNVSRNFSLGTEISDLVLTQFREIMCFCKLQCRLCGQTNGSLHLVSRTLPSTPCTRHLRCLPLWHAQERAHESIERPHCGRVERCICFKYSLQVFDLILHHVQLLGPSLLSPRLHRTAPNNHVKRCTITSTQASAALPACAIRQDFINDASLRLTQAVSLEQHCFDMQYSTYRPYLVRLNQPTVS